MSFKDTVLPDPLVKNCSVKYSTFKKTTQKPKNKSLRLLRGLPLPLRGNEGSEEEVFKLINLFPEKVGGTDAASFRGFGMEDIAAVENLVYAAIFMYDIDGIDKPMTSWLAKTNLGLYSSTVRLIRRNSHICYVSDINAFFKAHSCPSSGRIINEAGNRE